MQVGEPRVGMADLYLLGWIAQLVTVAPGGDQNRPLGYVAVTKRTVPAVRGGDQENRPRGPRYLLQSAQMPKNSTSWSISANP